MTTSSIRLLEGSNRELLEHALTVYVSGRRWFGGKARKITSIGMVEAAPMTQDGLSTVIALVQVDYADGEMQRYVLPLGFAREGSGQPPTSAVIATLPDPQDSSRRLTVYDATYDSAFTLVLLAAIREERTIGSPEGQIRASHTQTLEEYDTGGDVSPSVMGAEQSNTSIRYGDRYILKLFRRLEEGESPELEFGRYLSTKGFKNSPALLGAIEYEHPGSEPLTLAILQDFVPNQGDAWSFTLRSLDVFLEEAMALRGERSAPPATGGDLLQLASRDIPNQISTLAGGYLDSARLLARRTAELHLTLGNGAGDQAFAPEPFTLDYQTALFRAMNSTAESAFDLLREKVGTLPPGLREEAEAVLAAEDKVAVRFEPLLSRPIAAERTRVHGDYHLGQVLYTGNDFLIIDFEGEPVRPLTERRMKHSPLKDVAGMLRSFDYAAYAALFNYVARHNIVDTYQNDTLEAWAKAWQTWVSAAFLDTYLATANGGHVLPLDERDLQIVLNVNLLEKAVYELIYELNNRPDWIRIPLSGIAQLAG